MWPTTTLALIQHQVRMSRGMIERAQLRSERATLRVMVRKRLCLPMQEEHYNPLVGASIGQLPIDAIMRIDPIYALWVGMGDAMLEAA